VFSYQFINHPENFTLDLSHIDDIFRRISIVPHTLSDESADTLGEHQNGIINIAFLPDEEIQVLNNTYRNKDSTTDVLSFHYFDDYSDVDPSETAGEIILSESRILAQALEHNHSPERECEILIIHSLLHLLGYDHETDEEYERMWGWEKNLRFS
jgi:probable rRNA maturation factor